MAYDLVPPDPAGTIESLGALGYTLEAAIADLVDNSIDANATEVDVNFHWDGPNSYIAVSDNGHGWDPRSFRGLWGSRPRDQELAETPASSVVSAWA